MNRLMFKFHSWYGLQKPRLQIFLIFVIASPLQYAVVLMMLIFFCDIVSVIALLIALPLIACTGVITVSKMSYLILKLEQRMEEKKCRK